MESIITKSQNVFNEYESLVNEADRIFSHLKSSFPNEISCSKGCSDCCHALFDLSLIEALYLRLSFQKKFPSGIERFNIEERAGNVDRQLTKIKHKFFKDIKSGKSEEDVLKEASTIKIKCPLLDDNNECMLYDSRPITCRLYGLPVSIGGVARTCQKTHFDIGKQYPTVNMDGFQSRLTELSYKLSNELETKFKELHLMYVPVSSVLVTDYNQEYLGMPKGN